MVPPSFSLLIKEGRSDAAEIRTAGGEDELVNNTELMVILAKLWHVVSSFLKQLSPGNKRSLSGILHVTYLFRECGAVMG